MIKFLSIQQLSKKLGGRSRSSIYRDIKEGRLPEPIHFGRRIYWDEKALNDHLKKLLED